MLFRSGVFDDYLFYLLEIDIAENDDDYLEHEDTESIGYPFWHPFEWFEIIDDKMPGIWSFNLIEKYDKVNLSLIWGYKEIVSDYEHHKGLVHHDTKDLEIFYERKKEIDALSM